MAKRTAESFRKSKETSIITQFLVHYSLDLPVVVTLDASPYGLGAVIAHVVDGQNRLIAFASRTLTKAEKNYSQLEKETLVLVYAVKKFKQYLRGR